MKNFNLPWPCNPLLARLAALSVLAFPLLISAQADKPAAPAKPVANAKLPPAREVIEKFVKAIGGKEAFSKINSQHATGKCEMPAAGVAGDLEVFAMRPNKLFVKAKLAGIGELLEGFDGKVAWTLNPLTGPMVLEGKQHEQKREEADFNSVLHDEKDFKSMETVEVTQFDGKDCYKLKLVKKSGQEMTEYYDTQTGFLTGYTATQESPLGPITISATLSEYKKFGDVFFVTKTRQKTAGVELVMSISAMEFNKVDDSVFELPAQIKPLIKK
jgi:hypothetical protein